MKGMAEELVIRLTYPARLNYNYILLYMKGYLWGMVWGITLTIATSASPQEEIQTKHLSISYEEDLKGAKDIANLNKVVEELTGFLEEPADKIEITVYTDWSDYLDAGGRGGYLAFGRPGEILVLWDPEEPANRMLGEIAHEIVHQYFWQILGGRLYITVAGRWLEEGLAEYFRLALKGRKLGKRSISLYYLWMLIKEDEQVQDVEEIIEIFDISASRTNPQDEPKFANAWGFVHMLLALDKGEEIIAEYIEDTEEGSDMVENLETVLEKHKLSFDELNKRWLRYPLEIFEGYLGEIQQRVKKDAKMVERIKDFIKMLGGKETERIKALKGLKKLGESALPWLWEATKQGDKKIALCAEELLRDYIETEVE